jgi:glycine hydroxymethyltransferase
MIWRIQTDLREIEMTYLQRRAWVPGVCEDYIQRIAAQAAGASADAVAARIGALIGENHAIHDRDCINLNPATNVMNPAAEAVLAEGLGSRPSLGYPGDKYEMGLEAIEQIEVIAAELAAEIFQARYAEIRVPSGAIGNLYAFMACCKPGDAAIVPPPGIGGHVTHHDAGAAGQYGLNIHHAPVAADGYTVDVDGLAALASEVRPALITIGGSLNIAPHPVAAVRAIADGVGARLLFDAAHLCGMIAGRAWENPLVEGAHLMTMSTYKSLGGPAGGLVVTNDAEMAERLDSIAFPGIAGRGAGRRGRAGVPGWQHGHPVAPVRNRGGALWWRSGGVETPAPGQYPGLRHRPADSPGRGRYERAADRHARDRAAWDDGRGYGRIGAVDSKGIGAGAGGGGGGCYGIPAAVRGVAVRAVKAAPSLTLPPTGGGDRPCWDEKRRPSKHNAIPSPRWGEG